MANYIKCGKCGTYLASTTRHGFISCGCSNETFVDGNDELSMRVGGKDTSMIVAITADEFNEAVKANKPYKTTYNY